MHDMKNEVEVLDTDRYFNMRITWVFTIFSKKHDFQNENNKCIQIILLLVIFIGKIHAHNFHRDHFRWIF